MRLYEILEARSNVPVDDVFAVLFAGKHKTSEISGVPPISFTSKGGVLEDYLISGNTLQGGTPTPSAPVDVVGVGEKTKNLLDNQMSAEVDFRGVRYTKNTDGSVKVFGTASSQVSYCILMGAGAATNDLSAFTTPIFKAGDTIKFVSSGLALQIRYTDGTYGADVSGIVTLTRDVGLIYIQIANRSINTTVYPMITLSTETDTDYEPYGFKLPITVNGTEYPIYLGQVPTTRRIKKYTFTGEEIVSNCVATTDGQNYCVVFRYDDIGMNDIINYEETMADISYPQHVSSHFVNKTDNYSDYRAIFDGQMGANDYGSTGKAKNRYIIFCVAGLTTAADYSAWFAQQYAAGTPVVVWYVLTEQTTGIVNEPLHKIGDYADTVSMAQAGVTIPTVAGANTLTIDTTVQPSSVTIRGRIRPTL